MRLPPLVLLCCAACAGPDVAPEAPIDPPVELVEIHGRVVDSLSRAAVNTLVGIEGKFYPTDASGGFTASLPPGVHGVRVNAQGFEVFADSIRVRPADQFEFRLRRLAPYPIGCELYPDHFRAVIVDLQGRKTLERWQQSKLTLEAPAGPRSVGAILWGYRALDYYQWEITIPDVDPGTTLVDWDLFDSEGHNYTGSCEPVPTSPDSLS